MRDMFRGYYQPSEEEKEEIWQDGLITLDANVLLSLYKVQPSTSTLYLDAMHSRREQMWITHQAAAEFHRNVHAERARQTWDHKDRIKSIETFLEEIRKTSQRSRLQASELQSKAVESLIALKDELVIERDSIAKQTNYQTPDALLSRIAELFQARVGGEPSQSDLDTMYKDGEARFAKEMPPGFRDANKPDDRKYGDYLLWRQLMNHATSEKRDLIFVTDDDKEDWWLKDSSKRSVAPRPELIQEFRAETDQDILILNSSQFYHHLVPATVDGTRSEQVIAALKDMEAVVAEANEAAASQDPIEAALNQVEKWYPVSQTTQSLANARRHLEDRLSWGLPMDDLAKENAMQSALQTDYASITTEIADLEQRINTLEHQRMALPAESTEAEMLWREIDGIRGGLESKLDRRHQLHAYVRHYGR